MQEIQHPVARPVNHQSPIAIHIIFRDRQIDVLATNLLTGTITHAVRGTLSLHEEPGTAVLLVFPVSPPSRGLQLVGTAGGDISFNSSSLVAQLELPAESGVGCELLVGGMKLNLEISTHRKFPPPLGTVYYPVKVKPPPPPPPSPLHLFDIIYAHRLRAAAMEAFEDPQLREQIGSMIARKIKVPD